jgi:phosphatidate cytidylyltransferase
MGGLAGGLIIVIGYKLVLFPAMPWLAAVVMPIVVGTVSQVGDLCESFLKRAYDTKDSGSLLPGHGGCLDRFDSVVFSAPVMYGCVRLLAG